MEIYQHFAHGLMRSGTGTSTGGPAPFISSTPQTRPAILSTPVSHHSHVKTTSAATHVIYKQRKFKRRHEEICHNFAPIREQKKAAFDLAFLLLFDQYVLW